LAAPTTTTTTTSTTTTTLPICCAQIGGTGLACFWTSPTACQALGGTAGSPGSVCSGVGTCAATASPGPCCQFAGSCAEGGGVADPACTDSGGTEIDNTICMPNGQCQ
jgi:hypothetical protein